MKINEQIYILNDFYKWCNEHEKNTNWLTKEDIDDYVGGLHYDFLDDCNDLLEVQNTEQEIEEFLTKLLQDIGHYAERLN